MNNLEIKVNQILWQLLGIEPSDELKEQIELLNRKILKNGYCYKLAS